MTTGAVNVKEINKSKSGDEKWQEKEKAMKAGARAG